MASNQGLLIGLAEGLKSGLGSYSAESDRQEKRDIQRQKYLKDQQDAADRLELLKEQRENQNMQTNIEMKSKGLIKDDKGGLVQDPNSPVAKKGLLEQQLTEAQIAKTRAEAGKARSEVEGGGKPPTAEQFKAAGFAKRMEQAEKNLGDLEAAGYSGASIKQAAEGKYPQMIRPENAKLLQQAKNNFLNAVLRKESGAVIGPSEIATGDAQYFPLAGDSDKVKEQKRLNRLQAIESIKAEGGRAYGLIPTISAESNPPPAGLMQQKAVPQSTGGTSKEEDAEAYAWATANPKDPRAKAILGGK